MRRNPRKEQRRRECQCHFGEDDIVIDNIRLNPVNVFPAHWAAGQEMSFYMDDGDDIYLLTIRNNEKHMVTVFHDREIRDIVMELPMSDDNQQNLQNVVKALSSLPYAQKIRSGGREIFYI